MKVKMLVSRGGISSSANAGDIIEVGNDEGLRMIKAGQCIAQDKYERATKNKVKEKRA